MMPARLAIAGLLASAGTSLAIDLNAHPGPANNGGSPAWAIFMDFEALAGPVTVTHLSSANNGAANAAFSVEVFVRTGTALGGTLTTGPGSSNSGWTSLGTAPATQGPVASAVSLPIDIPDIVVNTGGITGVAILFTAAGPRYFGTGAGAPTVYQDAALKLTTGEARSAPFTGTGSFFVPRQLVGVVSYTTGGTPPCYANCDASTIAPVLNVNDFTCFINQYAAGNSYANCDASTIPPVLNVNDFTCFINEYAAGCN